MPQFYVLRPDLRAENSRVSLGEPMPWVTKPCSVYTSLTVSRRGLTIEAPRDRSLNFLWTWYSDLLVNQTARELLDRNSVSGCAFRRVVVTDRSSSISTVAPLCLWELEVTGFGGFVNARVGAEVENACEECSAYSFRMEGPFSNLIDVEKWDGSDIFSIWPFPSIRICTMRVVEVIGSGHMTGVVAIPIEEFGVSKISRFRQVFPQPRSRQVRSSNSWVIGIFWRPFSIGKNRGFECSIVSQLESGLFVT
jgi:hypothetical protein